MTAIEDRLEQLRVRWRTEPNNRTDIEDEVARLKGGLKLPAYIPPNSLAKEVEKHLGVNNKDT